MDKCNKCGSNLLTSKNWNQYCKCWYNNKPQNNPQQPKQNWKKEMPLNERISMVIQSILRIQWYYDNTKTFAENLDRAWLDYLTLNKFSKSKAEQLQNNNYNRPEWDF